MEAGYEIDILFEEARSRWLKPVQVLLILQNHEKYEFRQEPPQKPTSGSLFLFNKRVVRSFRKDGHNWRKKKDGRAIGEAHERLKVGNTEALNCYYAHGEQNPNFQRRSYWMLDPAYEHIVLVHYREITEGRTSPGSVAVSPGASSSFIMSPTLITTQIPGSTSVRSDLYEPYQNSSSSSSVEVTSEIASRDSGVDSMGGLTSSEAEVNQALRMLKEQLSLNDDMFEEINSLSRQDLECKSKFSRQDQFGASMQSPEYVVQEENKGLRMLKEQLSLNDDMFEEIDSLSRQDLECKSKFSRQDQFGASMQSPEYVVQEENKGLQMLREQLSLNDEMFEEIDSLSRQDLECKSKFSRQDQFGASMQSPEYVVQEENKGLRMLKEQLSLNDDMFEEIDSHSRQDLECKSKISRQDQFGASMQSPEYVVQYKGVHTGFQDHPNNLVLHQDAGNDGKHLQKFHGHDYGEESKGPLSWKDMLESCENSSCVESQEKPLSSSWRGPIEEQEPSCWPNINGSIVEHSSLLPQEVKKFEIPEYSSTVGTRQTNSICTTYFEQGHIGVPLEEDLRLTVAQKKKFVIREISPDWGCANEATKVIIVGSFLCDPSESAWSCMFGDIEVPLRIIQDGVIHCEAPPRPLGKVTLCITSGNRESCSEVKEFDYRVKNTSNICESQREATKSHDELLLLVRFVQTLLSDSFVQKEDEVESGFQQFQRMKADDDLWGQVIESVLVGSGTFLDTIDWLLQELLKDKLQQWLSSKSLGKSDQSGCSLSKREQGIIHMIAGLGFEWALNPTISRGVNINFRDINGWTALHWAARFGREKMVAALLASGASAGAVTDPNAQDPTGRTPASVAALSGHKGLAGYLSEVALTSHLSSLTPEESELSKNSAEVQAEITVHSVSNGNITASEDQLSLKDTLAAVRNATQAAARIQSAFRAHSFRKRHQRAITVTRADLDEYGINSDDIPELSAISKMAFRNVCHYNSAALSIQKKYRGWKGRKDYLAIRQKVVTIQAHVRGHQVRKKYKVCWAVGVMEKVILRWRRKGVGLRGFRQEMESNDGSEEEDILKVFRRQKVDSAIDEAVSRVLSMVDSPNARNQYRRMLERYRQAKAELGETIESSASSSSETFNMDDDDNSYLFV